MAQSLIRASVRSCRSISHFRAGDALGRGRSGRPGADLPRHHPRHCRARSRRNVALRACLIAGAILIGSALIGDWLLDTLGISLPAFRIAGGLLLFSIASEMVFGVRMRREGEAAEQAVEEHVRNIAAFPLAIPLMAGPGAITATVLLAGRADGNLLLLGRTARGRGGGCGVVLRRVPAGRRASAASSA